MLNGVDLFELKNFLLKMHEEGDKALSQGKLPCKDANGLLTGWEFDKEPYYNRGLRYIGLGMFQDQWETPLWKQAYAELVECGRLIENPDHKYHFQYLPWNEDKFYTNFITKKLVVPYQYREMYNQYIKSDAWKNKVSEILDRDHHECQLCGRKDDLQIHHTTYDRLFHEDNEDLICLCGDCHKKAHDEYDEDDSL